MDAIFLHESERWSGGARAFLAAARGLTARGWRVAFACLADGVVQQRVAEAGLEVVPLPSRPSFFGEADRLRRALLDREVDVVYVHGEQEQVAAANAVRRSRRGVVVRRVCAGESFVAGRPTRAALRTAPTTLLLTSTDQTKLPSDLGPVPTVVADLGVDVPAEPPTALPDAEAWPGEKRLVCVCDRGNRARTAVVLRAVAMLAPRHRDLRLVLVGPGADDEELRLHAAALGIHRFVRSAHTRDEDVAHRRAAHVGWVTAAGDDGAFGALDFMASSVPVLVDRGSIGARYVADAITGAHITPGDVPDTAATLATLLARDETRQAMGNAGRARVARTFGEAGMIDGFARAAAATQQRAATPRVAPR
ncbi:glycosyl transferase group 1 [Gemmatirosa kalamazoonensis]|uniref:Glycosyl transferase group 1 n=1 Tax=Gemmatirosa kalamazoonensis TaxID=861299 RepID=W0RH55_9BACT|nr:glycosyltransferase [Gemmatirosa kalamazoonensis]AHG90121.1 glycosyl transferase group 1 [Gemmatirosa kalamazoonensis]